MKAESALSSVVLPDPVPPLTRMLRRAPTAAASWSWSSCGERAELDQLLRARAHRREAADRQRRAVDGERRDHDVHPRPVLEPGVHHRAELVDPAAERRQDPLDRVAQRPLGREADIGPLDPAATLDVDPARGRSPSPPRPPGRRAAPPAARGRPPRAGSARRGAHVWRARGSPRPRPPARVPPRAADRDSRRRRRPAARRRSIRRRRSSAASSSRCLRRTRSSTSGLSAKPASTRPRRVRGRRPIWR